MSFPLTLDPGRRPAVAALPLAARVLLPLYLLASLAHFIHNAEYIAFYPGLPAWLSREQVYLAWLAVTAPGVLGLLAWRAGWRGAGLVLLALYGACGLDGLAHYTLALCSEHTLVTNLTIWGEAATGLALLLECSRQLVGRGGAQRNPDVVGSGVS